MIKKIKQLQRLSKTREIPIKYNNVNSFLFHDKTTIFDVAVVHRVTIIPIRHNS